MYIAGNITIYLGVAMSIYTVVAGTIGIYTKNEKWKRSARGGVFATTLLAVMAAGLLLLALGTSHFEFSYVAAYTSINLPMVYKLSAFWAGNAGSLLLWTTVLSLYTLAVSMTKKSNLIPYVIVILALNISFFFIVMVMNANPFEMTDMIPTDGKGLNPMLQNPGMVIHPVALYLGYVGMSIPFAFAIAALLMKEMSTAWITLTRKWLLTAWVFLTIGNVIGGWWAYLELGWGGYWAWDPVENASFLPWLTVSALLHSVMIQERKGMLKIWNISLIILSYILSLFGTFLVRSGILTSVHAFSDSTLGGYFLVFITFMTLFSLYIVISRYPLLKKDSRPFDSYLSKESSFLLNNIILVAAAFAVFWGTMYPLISEMITGTKINLGAPYFNKVMAPIMFALIILMGICPLISWSKSTPSRLVKNMTFPFVGSLFGAGVLIFLGVKGWFAIAGFSAVLFMAITHIREFYLGVIARKKASKENMFQAMVGIFTKNSRRYGGYLVHMGVAILAIGVIATNAYSIEKMVTLSVGDSANIGPYNLKFIEMSETSTKGNDLVLGHLRAFRDGSAIGELVPEKIYYENWPEASSEVALLSSWRDDLYVVLNSWEDETKATFLLKVNPFVGWIWSGGIVMVLGTVVAMAGRKGKSQVSGKLTKNRGGRP